MEEEKVGRGRERGKREGKGWARRKARNAEIKVKRLGKKRDAGKGRGEKFSFFFFLEHVRSFRRSIGETIVARRTLRDC